MKNQLRITGIKLTGYLGQPSPSASAQRCDSQCCHPQRAWHDSRASCGELAHTQSSDHLPRSSSACFRAGPLITLIKTTWSLQQEARQVDSSPLDSSYCARAETRHTGETLSVIHRNSMASGRAPFEDHICE